MNIQKKFGFYAVLTNPLLGYELITKVCVDKAIAFVQLRMKDAPRDEILPVAYKLRKITAGTSTKFIINDDPEIARSVGADGVHIGQTDMSINEVRTIVGPDAIIGVSTHSPSQTIATCALAPDYIGVGPVFPTPTKKIADPAIGIHGMKEMLSLATVPAVSIGGIDLSNIEHVLEAGARNFCMVRQFVQSEHPEQVLDAVLKIYNRYVG